LRSTNMNSFIFKIVANFLSYMGQITGRTYNEMNIIVYYFIIPFTWMWLLDIIFDFHYLKIAFGVFTIGFAAGCRDFRTYSDWLFNKSYVFLNYFNRYGSNYIASSVWICVSIPIVVYGVLLYFVFK
jgi:hypothetical protein